MSGDAYYDEAQDRWVDPDEDDDDGPSSRFGGGQLEVELPSGSVFPVLTDEEYDYLERRVQLYAEHNAMRNISDLQDLDEIIRKEFFLNRWGIYLSKGEDYNGQAIDEASLRRDADAASKELRLAKKHLGLDKAARERQQGENSFPVWIANLLRRAGAFGVNRNKMAAKAIELAMELIGLVTFAKNLDGDDDAKREFAVTDADIIEWIRTIFQPEFEAIDKHFRENVQSTWIRNQ